MGAYLIDAPRYKFSLVIVVCIIAAIIVIKTSIIVIKTSILMLKIRITNIFEKNVFYL